ncbi:MAG: methyltetrahydrofolate cobalamin methyltransferase [Thermodesulfobacteriota bacterium]
MIIVGELINSSRKAIKAAIDSENVEEIQKIAKDQYDNGADYIDINAGTFVGKEDRYMKWLVETVQNVVETPCCIDSPDPQVIEAAMALHKGTPMINSISLEKERYDALLPVVAGTDLKVIALCMSDKGMPETKDDRLAIASDLINNLVKNNVALENIYVDPLVQPISTNDSYGIEFVNAIEAIMTEFPGVHTMCGLSNISYGLPERKLLNQAFMVMAISKGLDGAIINPLDRRMMANIYAAETLAGRDEFCSNYLMAYREQKLAME